MAALAIPNVALVKEASRPHVYFVCGGTKMWIPDPTDFARVGFRWDKVRTVPDGTLAGHVDKPFTPPATTKASDVFFASRAQCTSYRDLNPFHFGQWHPNLQQVESLLANDVLVVGWLTEDPVVHLWPHGCEDIFYNVELDPEFVSQMYGPGGLSTRLDGQFYRGNLGESPGTAPPLPVEDVEPTLLGPKPKGVTFNSFILPGGNWVVHGELNAWHVSDTTGPSRDWGWPHHYIGRGVAPAGWQQITIEGHAEPEGGGDSTFTKDQPWFPWDLYAPSGDRLANGDYVMMRGPIWQDVVHGGTAKPETDPWHAGATFGHEGWVEMHPIDWIVRLQPRPPGARKTGRHFARATWAGIDEVIEDEYTRFKIPPEFPPSKPSRRLSVADVEEIVDGRCSDMAMVIPHSRWGEFGGKRWKSFGDHVEVNFKIQGTAGRQGRFKASYIVTWHETDDRDQVWIDDALPAGARALGDESWLWVTDHPKPFIGTQAHRSQSNAGLHQHFFDSATAPLGVGPGDVLFAMVYLDPDASPRQVMLQWNDGSWEHRAYWGDNLVGWGVDGTTSCRRIGDLPESGAWIRLEIPAAAVGLEGRAVNGIAFTLYDGRATWDYVGKVVALPLDAAFVGQNVTDVVEKQQKFSASVTMRNTGATTWTQAGGFQLGSQYPNYWGVSHVNLPVAAVPSGQTVTFNFTATAPNNLVSLSFQWRMVQSGGNWFGEPTELVRITVEAPPSPL